MKLRWHLLGEVVRLRPVLRGVQLPDVVVESRHLRGDHPWRAVPGHRSPALVIDAAVDEHLEVLRLVLIRSPRVVVGVGHADALYPDLLAAVYRYRLR